MLLIIYKGIHKHYGVQDWCDWSATHKDVLPFVAVSSGTSDADFAKVDAIMDAVDVPFICLDVANGYSEHVRTSLLTLCMTGSTSRHFMLIHCETIVHLESLIKVVHNLPPALMPTFISNTNFNNFIPIYHIFHILLIDISIL